MSVLPDEWRARGDALHIGAHDVGALATRFGTPLYAYDAAVMRARFRALKAAVAGFANIFYSVKANPNIDILRLFVAEGAGLEVASAGEYSRARAAGAAPRNIIFAGPAKADRELDLAIGSGLGELHVESLGEIARAAAIATRLGVRQRVALRINPSPAAQGGAIRMGGGPAPFEIDEEEYAAAVDVVLSCDSLTLTGVHIYAGTQILDADVLRRQWAHGLALARSVAGRLAAPLETIDLGGGLGVPLFAGERPLDLDLIADLARDLAREKAHDPAIASARVLLEPGRFLVAEAGVYLTRVLDVKVSRGKRFALVDGGMHHHLAASGNLGQAIKRDFPVVVASRMAQAANGTTVLAGPLCTPLDVLARQAQTPALEPGDLIAVLRSGAYGLSASPIEFLSHPTPAEILIDGDDVREIRARGVVGRSPTQ